MSAPGRPHALIPEPDGGEGTPASAPGRSQALIPEPLGGEGIPVNTAGFARRALLAAALPGLAWARHALAAGDTRRLRVVATFSILADLVREVASDAAEVVSLVGPDSDAHVYQPRPSDVQRIASADLVVVNGLGFEGWIERLVRVAGGRAEIVVASSGVVARRQGNAVDPHAWQDPRLLARYVDNLSTALARLRPDASASFAQRAEALRARLASLDAMARQTLAAVPAAERRVIASHDAFGYLADAYGITFLSPRGWSTEAEPSAADIAALVRQVRRQRVRALFVENISDRRLTERIGRETGLQVGGVLYSDALSAAGGPADTALKLVEHNLRTVTRALATPPSPPGAPNTAGAQK